VQPDCSVDGGTHDLVRELHDEAAGDSNVAVASVRPLGTTRFELWLMARDAARKLRVDGKTSVLEIGCGVGVLGLPLARRAPRYVGIDIAEKALAVFRERLAAAGLGEARVSLRSLDFVNAPNVTVESLGRFDRVIAYAVLHYVATESEGRTFVARALSALEPGGRALFGNLPLADLQDDLQSAASSPPGRVGRVAEAVTAAIGAARPNALGGVATRRARVANRLVKGALSWLRPVFSGAETAPRSLPAGTTLELSKDLLEQWLDHAAVAIRWEWLPPGPGTPLAGGRADLLVVRDG
jgi:2-polyprenyl-3-methyl-5-hydroxy-6-metoxy-1,4-benzoquinol methylase